MNEWAIYRAPLCGANKIRCLLPFLTRKVLWKGSTKMFPQTFCWFIRINQQLTRRGVPKVFKGQVKRVGSPLPLLSSSRPGIETFSRTPSQFVSQSQCRRLNPRCPTDVSPARCSSATAQNCCLVLMHFGVRFVCWVKCRAVVMRPPIGEQ